MMDTTERILVIKLGAFGDIVQADGAMRDIRAFHPDAEITLLTMPPFRKLMSRCPYVDHVITDTRAPFWKIGNWIRLARTLREGRFTHAYDLQRADRTALYRRLFLRHVVWSGKEKGEHPKSGLDGLLNQLQRSGVPTLHCMRPDVSWMADDMSAFLKQEGVRNPYVALIPGCSARHPQKRWPCYAELAARLLDKGYDVVTAPGPDELDLAKGIPGHTLLGPNGYLNWFELAGVLKDAGYVVGNDTGPSHVAACMGKAGLALFGPHTSALRTGIRRGQFDALEVPDLAGLSVDTVLETITPRLPRLQENSV